MAHACDLVVASCTAQLGLPEVTRGLIASAGGLLRLSARLPHSVAMRMALTGERLTGEQAFDLHLVSELVEPGCALEPAVALAARIAKNAPLSVQASKHLINAAADGRPTRCTASRSVDQRATLGRMINSLTSTSAGSPMA